MKNIDYKDLYWTSSKEKRKEIKNLILKRDYTCHRLNMANYDILIYVIEPFDENDEKVCVMVNGIFTIAELEQRCIYININNN